MLRRSACSTHYASTVKRKPTCCQCRVPSKSLRVVCAAGAAMRTHYDVLGVRDSASVRDIKDAFRRLALMWHPDRCKQPGAKDKFMELKAAYDTLVDLTARAKYDLQIKQAAQPATARPTTVGYDWSKYRSSTVHRSSSSRKEPPPSARSSVPPRPPSRPSFGDDFDAVSGASGANNSIFANSNAATVGTSGRRSTARVYRAASTTTSSNGGYQSIFGDARAAAAEYNRTSSVRSGSSGSSGAGANSIFSQSASSTHQQSAYQQASRATSAFSRASSRCRSRSRASSSGAWSSRPAAPTAAQQWHSMYCHSGDDYVASTGTSYAASTALVRAAVYAEGGGQQGTAASSHGSAPGAWHGGNAGDGFALVVSSDTGSRGLTVASDASSIWRSSSHLAPGGDDYDSNMHALVRVEQQQTLPAKLEAQWNSLASFISVRMT